MSPTFIFVAGSWHPTAYYQPLIRTLADAGHASVAVTPRCLDSSPPATSFQPDADALKDAIVGLVGAGRDVIVVGHSYGGIVMTDAVGDLVANQPDIAKGVKRLVYLTAFVPAKGQSLMDQIVSGPPPVPDLLFDIVDGNQILRDTAKEALYHDVPEPDRSWYFSQLGKQPDSIRTVPVSYQGWESVPSTYIYTTLDRVVFIHLQKHIVECARKSPAAPFGGPLGEFTLETGHSPMLSGTSELADILGRVARET